MTVFRTPDDMAPATASRAVKNGRMRRVARGLVTDELIGPIEGVVAAHLLEPLDGRCLVTVLDTADRGLSGTGADRELVLRQTARVAPLTQQCSCVHSCRSWADRRAYGVSARAQERRGTR